MEVLEDIVPVQGKSGQAAAPVAEGRSPAAERRWGRVVEDRWIYQAVIERGILVVV